jgi:hypothetical protein
VTGGLVSIASGLFKRDIVRFKDTSSRQCHEKGKKKFTVRESPLSTEGSPASGQTRDQNVDKGVFKNPPTPTLDKWQHAIGKKSKKKGSKSWDYDSRHQAQPVFFCHEDLRLAQILRPFPRQVKPVFLFLLALLVDVAL